MHWRKRKKLRRIAQHHGYKHWHSFNKYAKLYRMYYKKYNDPILAKVYTILNFYNNKLKSKYNIFEIYDNAVKYGDAFVCIVPYKKESSSSSIEIKFTINDEIYKEVSI